MKELTIEQKAQRYDEAIEVARKIKNGEPINAPDGTLIPVAIFPELKESEDERIMENIIATIHLYYGEPLEDKAKEMIAWLERRGQAFNKKDIYDAYLKGICDAKHEIEKQGEQNPADKAEQKFKIGDLITNGILVGKIDKIHKWGYHAFFGGHYADVPDVENWHKWTIQDARDGDVLYNKDEFSGNSVFIYKGISNKTLARFYYARLFKDKDFCIHNDVMWENGVGVNGGEFYPATKEQRATLMKAMADAGYEWDADKKELKKIEQNPAETEKGAKGNERDIPSSAWSEEDDKLLELSVDNLTELKNRFGKEYGRTGDCINWLKFLKERYTWKPSEGQLECLGYAIAKAEKDWSPLATNRIYLTLKALKEQLLELRGSKVWTAKKSTRKSST